MTVARILKDKGSTVYTVPAAAPLQAAVDVLAEHRVGVLVVTGSDGGIGGILSERDVIRALSGNAASGVARSVADVMTRDIETCTPEDAESEVMARMNAKGIRHLPVVSDGKLVGLVSMRDVIKLRIAKIDEMMRAIRREAGLLK